MYQNSEKTGDGFHSNVIQKPLSDGTKKRNKGSFEAIRQNAITTTIPQACLKQIDDRDIILHCQRVTKKNTKSYTPRNALPYIKPYLYRIAMTFTRL